MNPLELYEAYSAVYDEDLREDLLSVEEDFSFIDELSDNELDQVMEEILSEGVELSECVQAFDEVLTEARVDMSARAAARKQYMQQSEKSAKEARGRAAAKERAERRAERVQRIKSSAKRAAERVGTTAAGVASAAAGGAARVGRAAKEAKFKAVDAPAASYAAKRGIGGPGPGLLARSKDPAKRRALRAAVLGDIASRAKAKLGRGAERVRAAGEGAAGAVKSSSDTAQANIRSFGSSVKSGAKGLIAGAARSVSRGARNVARRMSEDVELIASYILEDLIDEGYADTFEEAVSILETFTDYEVGEIAENYLIEETVNLYDVVLEYLLDEGFADTEESANVIMANMSEEWREEILDEAVRGSGRSIGNMITGNDIRAVTRGGKTVYKKPRSDDQVETQVRRDMGREGHRNPYQYGSELTKQARASANRMNAIKNVELTHDYDDDIDIETTSNDSKSGYKTVPTDYRARKRRASGR